MCEDVIYRKAPVHRPVLVTDLTAKALLVTDLCLETIDKGRGRKSVESLILGSEVLSIPNHTVDLILREVTPLVDDGDRFRLATMDGD